MTLNPKTPILLLSGVLAGSSLLLTACGPSGSETKAQTQLEIQGTKPDGTASRSLARATSGAGVDIPVYDANGSADGTLHLTTAWMVVKEVDLEMDDEEEDDEVEGMDSSDDDSEENEIEFVGPYVVDLLTSSTNPSLPSLLVEAGQYDDIEIDIEKLNPDDLDGDGNPLIDNYPELEDYSLYLEGTYTSEDGSTYNAIPFELKYDQTDEFDLATSTLSNPLALNSDQSVDLIVAFRMARWFRFDDPDTNDPSDNIDSITGAIQGNDTDGLTLILDGNTNSDYMDIVEDNIEDSADFGEDDDDDGELDSDEDEDDDDEWDDDSEDDS